MEQQPTRRSVVSRITAIPVFLGYVARLTGEVTLNPKVPVSKQVEPIEQMMLMFAEIQRRVKDLPLQEAFLRNSGPVVAVINEEATRFNFRGEGLPYDLDKDNGHYMIFHSVCPFSFQPKVAVFVWPSWHTQHGGMKLVVELRTERVNDMDGYKDTRVYPSVPQCLHTSYDLSGSLVRCPNSADPSDVSYYRSLFCREHHLEGDRLLDAYQRS